MLMIQGTQARILAALFAALLLQPALAGAQSFPTKPIRLITLTTPGGALDTLARTIAQGLTERLGQPVLVEARTGAGGNIGAEVVAKSAPDGYTIGMVTVSTHGINPTLYGAKMPFDAVKDFAPITLASVQRNIVVVNPAVPARNIAELVAYARANPGKISFGSAGTGTSQHLSGELFKVRAGIDMVHVPYKGAAQAMPDLISGQISLMFVTAQESVPHVRAGKLRAIGVTSLDRSPVLPDAAPIAEQGYPGFDVRAWFGVVAPAGTAADIVNRYNREISATLAQSATRDRLAGIGMDVATSTPEQFAAHIRAEIAKWAPVVKASGAKVQ
jgi:tripartite-type tricarboxylate transporter receptor subunit TctC